MSPGQRRGNPPAAGRLIEDSSELAAFCRALEGAGFIAVDTEFMRESTYWPRLCLLQIAGPEEAAAIDPLVPGMDLGPVHGLMADDTLLKVFHAGRQDLEIFFHATGRLPAPVFDTQIAAMVCGFGDSVGYEVLASKLAGARIDKSSRFTDWSLRPLSRRQIDYALSDVIHLRAIYEKLNRRLERNGRTAWLEEEVRELTAAETYDADPRHAHRRIKCRGANPRVLAVLQEVAAWREEEAQRRDLPRNRVLRDEAIAEIAHHAPRSVDELARTRGLSRKLAGGPIGQAVLIAVARGMQVPEEACPRPPPRLESRPEAAPVADLLRLLLKVRCREAGVAQRLVATADDVGRIAAFGERADTATLKGWRRRLFGEDALKLLSGETAIAVQGGRATLVPLSEADP